MKCGVCGYACTHTSYNAATGACAVCGTAHNHAGCRANGVCSVCGYPCDHGANTNVRSCEQGADCSICGLTLSALDHNWSKKDGQCAREGCDAVCEHDDYGKGVLDGCTVYYECLVCGHPKSETAHDWSNKDGKCAREGCDARCSHAYVDGVCTVCGLTEPKPEPTPAPTPEPTPVSTPEPTPEPTPVPHSHHYTGTVTTVAGCVTPGVRTYSCSCGASYTESIPATGHDWTTHYSIMTGDSRATYTCSVCGASEKMSFVSPGSAIAGRLDSDPQEIKVTVEAADETVKENVEVKGAVLPNGGTAYVISEKVGKDGEAAESISLQSENEDIRYVGYQRTDEKGAATEILELNAAKGLASVDILRGELENGTPTITVKENRKLIDLVDVSASLDDEQLSYSITTESGSELGYSTVQQATQTIKQITSYWEGVMSRNAGDSSTTIGGNVTVEVNKPLVIDGGITVSPVLLSEKDTSDQQSGQSDKQSERSHYGDHGELVDSKVELGGDRNGSEPDRNEEPGNDILSELGEGYTYLETADGGVIVPAPAKDEDGGADATPTPAPSTTPTPESTEDVWVTISFEKKTLHEDDTTIAAVADDDSPTIVRFVDTTPTPAPIQEYVTPTPSPTPTPEPTESVSIMEHLETLYEFEICPQCGEQYKVGTKHSCKKSCVPTGTMITLADGTQKPVEDITAEDICLVFDHETGTFTTAGILFLEDDGVKEYSIVNLEFSDGSVTRLIDEHGYFDLDGMGYVYITEDNCADYIGHRFYAVKKAKRPDTRPGAIFIKSSPSASPTVSFF